MDEGVIENQQIKTPGSRRAKNATGAVILGWLISIGGGNTSTGIFSLCLIIYGVYLGYKSLKQIKTGHEKGSGWAWFSIIAGLILLAANLIIFIVLISHN